MKLEFKNVTKQYGEVNAVNKVNCVMEKGIYGLLGVNGAGKTTLMRMLCTIVQPRMRHQGTFYFKRADTVTGIPRSSGIFTTGFWILSRFDRI